MPCQHGAETPARTILWGSVSGPLSLGSSAHSTELDSRRNLLLHAATFQKWSLRSRGRTVMKPLKLNPQAPPCMVPSTTLGMKPAMYSFFASVVHWQCVLTDTLEGPGILTVPHHKRFQSIACDIAPPARLLTLFFKQSLETWDWLGLLPYGWKSF